MTGVGVIDRVRTEIWIRVVAIKVSGSEQELETLDDRGWPRHSLILISAVDPLGPRRDADVERRSVVPDAQTDELRTVSVDRVVVAGRLDAVAANIGRRRDDRR